MNYYQYSFINTLKPNNKILSVLRLKEHMYLITVTALTCNDDKTIDLTVSIDAEGYYVSIVGCAEEQQISSQTATLSNCSLVWVCALFYSFFFSLVWIYTFLYVCQRGYNSTQTSFFQLLADRERGDSNITKSGP